MKCTIEMTGQRMSDSKEYHRTQMQKERILSLLKERGFRITKQRRMLLDIILEEDCSSCKEIYYKALKLDERIGTATVYRMVNSLEDIGAISRKNMYKIACNEQCDAEQVCTIELMDDTIFHLNASRWKSIITAGLRACGYTEKQEIRSVVVRPCECRE